MWLFFFSHSFITPYYKYSPESLNEEWSFDLSNIAETLVAMELFYILTVVLDSQTYT